MNHAEQLVFHHPGHSDWLMGELVTQATPIRVFPEICHMFTMIEKVIFP